LTKLHPSQQPTAGWNAKYNPVSRRLLQAAIQPDFHIIIMKPTRILLASLLAIALVACANQKNDYDTQAAAVTPNAGPPPTAANLPGQPANPTYDTPPAYQESAAAPINPEALAPPSLTTQERPAAATAEVTHAAATEHIVVAHDTLGGIAKHYKVPIASIKKANNMTNDTVILGKKMIIPAH
jgi:LysM repeat protein